MQITVGIQHTSREVTVETDLTRDDALELVEKALSGSVLVLDDVKGRRVVIPADAVAYVELGSDTAHPVGFLR